MSKAVFRLKTMVLARIFAELTAIMLLIGLPFLLILLGKYSEIAMPWRWVTGGLALAAACLLPVYGFITYQVRLTDEEIVASRFFGKLRCRFDKIKSLSRRSNFNIVRYVVESTEDTELSFPVWLNQCELLVSILRDKLPIGSGGKSAFGRVYKQDTVAVALQMVQVVLSLIFIVIAWFFAFGVKGGSSTQNGDVMLLFAFAAIASLLLLYRAWRIFMIPLAVSLDDDSFAVRTLVNKQTFLFRDLMSVHAPWPVLPEGFEIKTKRGSYLVGTGMNDADELESALKSKLVKPQATP